MVLRKGEIGGAFWPRRRSTFRLKIVPSRGRIFHPSPPHQHFLWNAIANWWTHHWLQLCLIYWLLWLSQEAAYSTPSISLPLLFLFYSQLSLLFFSLPPAPTPLFFSTFSPIVVVVPKRQMPPSSPTFLPFLPLFLFPTPPPYFGFSTYPYHSIPSFLPHPPFPSLPSPPVLPLLVRLGFELHLISLRNRIRGRLWMTFIVCTCCDNHCFHLLESFALLHTPVYSLTHSK